MSRTVEAITSLGKAIRNLPSELTGTGSTGVKSGRWLFKAGDYLLSKPIAFAGWSVRKYPIFSFLGAAGGIAAVAKMRSSNNGQSRENARAAAAAPALGEADNLLVQAAQKQDEMGILPGAEVPMPAQADLPYMQATSQIGAPVSYQGHALGPEQIAALEAEANASPAHP